MPHLCRFFPNIGWFFAAIWVLVLGTAIAIEVWSRIRY